MISLLLRHAQRMALAVVCGCGCYAQTAPLRSSVPDAASQDTGNLNDVVLPPAPAPAADDSGSGLINSAGEISSISCQDGLANSAWLSCDGNQQLHYTADGSSHATLLDFSSAGYHNGGVAFWTPPIARTLKPSGGDDTAALQQALNAVAALPADGNGLRGQVFLQPGTYTISSALRITQSGVALQGSASSGPQASILRYTGNGNTAMLLLTGSSAASPTGPVWPLSPGAVAAGSSSIVVPTAPALSPGTPVQLNITRNLAWITMMWGGSYPPLRNNLPQAAWGQTLTQGLQRRVLAADGSTLQLDAPISDAIPAASYLASNGLSLQQFSSAGRLREVGISHLQAQGRFIAGDVSNAQLTMLSINNAEDCYVDDITATDFGFIFVDLQTDTQRITVQDVHTKRTDIQSGSAKPFDFSIRGQQTLLQGCSAEGNKTFYATPTSTQAMGPTVVQNFRTLGAGSFEPHQRWSVGILYDNIYAPNAGIALLDRGTDGSGQGWSAGYSLVYNSLAGTENGDTQGMDAKPGLTINQPPQAANWGVGLIGPNRSSAASPRYDSAGTPVGPASLWAHQLWQRGPNAAMDTIIGPWHIRDGNSQQCLCVQAASAGTALLLDDCTQLGARALWDITSRGSLRLGGTSLCLEASGGSTASLASCVDSGAQHWQFDSRAGFASHVGLVAATAATAASCLQGGTNQASLAMAACSSVAKTWHLVVTTLARP